ncbi:MAG TPA: PE PGRS family protein [Polyangiaceae bacterium]|nr:PE PGRS family protein [Polyangiaceae bacterium]
MHLRRLTLVAFAAPILFAACSSDSNDGGRPNRLGEMPDQTTDEMQTNTGNSPGTGDVGSTPGGELPNTDTQLQPSGPDTPGDGTNPEVTVNPLNPVGTVEDRGVDCQVPALPAGNTLPNTTNLPDPFTRLDGTRITQKSDWVCRREEILQQVYQYIYGAKPRKPDSVTGTVSETQVTVNITHNGQNESFSAAVTVPEGPGPFPAVISFSGSGPVTQIAAMGVAVIRFNQGDVGSRNSGIFGRLYANNTAGDLAAWAWGASRIVDVLQAAGNTVIDSTKLAVTGCSFLGKAAFATGALDERFTLTIPLESGIGGVPSYKIVPVLEPNPTGAGDGPEQPQHAINNGWLPSGSLVGNFNALPVDTHEIIGLVAPRGLLVLGNTGTQGQYYKNLDFRSEHATAMAGKEIYTALGVTDSLSYDSRAVNHCQNTDRFTAAVEASVGRFLVGNGSATGTFTTDWEDVRVAPTQFIDWTTPTLEGEL